MILPMMGFFLMLIVAGGLGSLVASADPTRARLFPFTLAMLFSGTAVWIIVLGFGALGETALGPAVSSILFFLFCWEHRRSYPGLHCWHPPQP
jgi:hypothetical protein